MNHLNEIYDRSKRCPNIFSLCIIYNLDIYKEYDNFKGDWSVIENTKSSYEIKVEGSYPDITQVNQ